MAADHDDLGAPEPRDSSEETRCCCSVENGEPYCGDPGCDIYYCEACGDEFSEPCPRHEEVDHA